MAWTARQRQAIGEAFCQLFEIPTSAIGKPGLLLNFLEATKAQQLTALKTLVQTKRAENQADYDAAPTIATNAQTALTADNVELDDLIAQL